jgi:hypothetical protein
MREKIAYIFEQGERAHELLKFFLDIEKKRGKAFWGLRSHHFPGKECVLLQASDLIAGSVQKLLLQASEAVKCLDNGEAFTPIHNFEHYYSKDGVTASVLPSVSSKFRSVVNKPVFGRIDSITDEALAKYPDILDGRLKSKTNQGKRNKGSQ